MKKCFVIARPPSKPNLSWDYPVGYFPRICNYMTDGRKLERKAKIKGGEGVEVKDFTQTAYEAAVKQAQIEAARRKK